MSVLDRHLEFLEALRAAGIPVSISEDVDAVRALSFLPLLDRDVMRDAYAATLVKRQILRPAFDAIFDVHFPEMIGDGAGLFFESTGHAERAVGDNIGDVLETIRRRIDRALSSLDLDDRVLRQLASEAVGRFGSGEGRAQGALSWSMYDTLQRLDVQGLVDRLVESFAAGGQARADADALAQRRVSQFVQAVAEDIERRMAQRRTPQRRTTESVRPVLDRLAFSSARQSDLKAMRREVQLLARRLASRLARERRMQGRGPLDFRRTMRSAMASGGVPLDTRHRPKRPHRTDLVVLCDISGSVADFAQFTLLLVFALREVFQGLRVFTFIDDVTEVTARLMPGADISEVVSEVVGSTREALLAGRSDYGRVLERFAADHADALTPRTTLLVLGDARSNYSPLHEQALADIVGEVKRAFWLNPEPRSAWGIGDSGAQEYAAIIEMVECGSLEQLGDFARGLL